MGRGDQLSESLNSDLGSESISRQRIEVAEVNRRMKEPGFLPSFVQIKEAQQGTLHQIYQRFESAHAHELMMPDYPTAQEAELPAVMLFVSAPKSSLTNQRPDWAPTETLIENLIEGIEGELDRQIWTAPAVDAEQGQFAELISAKEQGELIEAEIVFLPTKKLSEFLTVSDN